MLFVAFQDTKETRTHWELRGALGAAAAQSRKAQTILIPLLRHHSRLQSESEKSEGRAYV